MIAIVYYYKLIINKIRAIATLTTFPTSSFSLYSAIISREPSLVMYYRGGPTVMWWNIVTDVSVLWTRGGVSTVPVEDGFFAPFTICIILTYIQTAYCTLGFCYAQICFLLCLNMLIIYHNTLCQSLYN